MAKKTKHKFKFIDLFSGIGGFRIASEQLEGKCVAFSEIDSKAIGVYKENFDTDDEIEMGDITKFNSYPYADILFGGVPCQSWSIAGKMRGFEDPRGRLWLDTINFTKLVNPKGFIYENVKGLADPRNKENLNLIVSEFSKIGFNTYYSVLNAFDYGLPQSRERIFIVGIRKDLDKNMFEFPTKFETLPLLSDILETTNGSVSENYKKNHDSYKNGFNMAAIVNKGNFYTFSDVRNGDNTIHSWDIIKTTKKEKEICIQILKNRRKSKYGEKDGNPMSAKDIINLFSENTLFDPKETVGVKDIERLVDKGILRKVDNKYEFTNSKISSGIDGVYRIFLPESHVFSTLTKSGNRDFIAETPIPPEIEDKKTYVIENIFKRKKYRPITVKEASRLQGFPETFNFSTRYNTSLGLLGNAVAVNVVKLTLENLLPALDIN